MRDSAYVGSLIPHSPCYATAIHPSIISHVSPLPRSLEPRCHLLYTFPQHVLHNFHYSARHGMNRCVFRRHLGLPRFQLPILSARLMYPLYKSEGDDLSLSCAFIASAVPSPSSLSPALRTNLTFF